MVADSGGDRIAMGWLRQRWGSYLALAVLVFQLALTFGHVHLNLIGSPANQAAISAAAGTTPDAPVSPDAPDHEHCATCALVHLAQTLVTPVAPVVLLPASVRHQTIVVDPVRLPARTLALFRARAPPLA